jgi:hypothetical protein
VQGERVKIDKIVFSCSEPPAYSSYWNTNSRLWRQIGIEPVCLLFGKRANTDMREDHGTVIEMPIIEGLPWALQMVWSKFNHTRSEPDTTWIIGDIDLLPLQRYHFTDRIARIPDEDYACLNSSGISSPRIGMVDGFERRGSERHGKDKGFIGADLPAHYHVAKGSMFEGLYFCGASFEDSLKMFVESDRYGLGPMNDYPEHKRTDEPYWWYWCAEEGYTSYTLFNAMRSGQVTFHGIAYNNTTERVNAWDKGKNDYAYNAENVRAGKVVDVHCCWVRPYAGQADQLERLLSLAGMN